MSDEALPVPLLPELADFWQSKLMESLRLTVEAWSACVARVTQWEQAHLVDAPTPDDLKAHRKAVDRMIVFGRLVSLSTTHKDFPDRRLARMVRATLQAYEDKLSLWHDNTRTEAEREALLREVFSES